MTEHKKHPHDAVIRAWLDGKVIQCSLLSRKEWGDIPAWSPSDGGMPPFHPDIPYRIKPETIRYRVALFLQPADGSFYTYSVEQRDYRAVELGKHFIRWISDEQEVAV